eukprot:scaffold45093_cov74-Phaeocystis_antarctica.AAC.5
MAMPLPKVTQGVSSSHMPNGATIIRAVQCARPPVDAIIEQRLRRDAEEVVELATALFLLVLVHHDNLQAALELSCSSHVAF